MKLTLQKRLAAEVLKVSHKKVVCDPTQLAKVKEAITKADIRNLISSGVITVKQTSHHSRSGARAILAQRRKGRMQGHGHRKGAAGARQNTKDTWVARVRAQRAFLSELKAKKIVDNKVYRDLYTKSHGGYFRNVRHIKLFIQENNLALKAAKVAAPVETKKPAKKTTKVAPKAKPEDSE